MKRVAQFLMVGMFFFFVGVGAGAGLLLTSDLPLSAIHIDMRTGMFRFKLRELVPIPSAPGKRADGTH
jgi:hypothetical protein